MSVFTVPTDKKVYLKYDTSKEVVLDTAQFNIDPRPDIRINYTSYTYDEAGFISGSVENTETHEVTVGATRLFNTFQFTYDLSDYLSDEPKGVVNPYIKLHDGFWGRGPFQYADASNIYLPDNISSEIDYVNSFQNNEIVLQFSELVLDEFYNYDKAYLVDTRIVFPKSNFTQTEYVADLTYISNQTYDVVTERITLNVDPEHNDSLTFVSSIELGTGYFGDLQFDFLGHQEDLGINGVLIPNSRWGAYDAYERKLEFINEQFNGVTSIISNPSIQIVGDIIKLNSEFVENKHDIDFVYKWYRDNELIPGYSEASYKIQSTDMGSNIRVEIEYADDIGNEGVLESKNIQVAVKEFPYEIFPTKGAFSILSEAGTVQAWGNNRTGGSINTPNVLNEVEEIYVGQGKYAALFSDGTVSTWGNDKSAQVPFFGKSYPVENIYMDGPGFVALKLGGTVSSWGSPYNDPGIENLTDVVKIFSSSGAHAALKTDGSVYVWGRSDYEGDTSAVADQISSGVVEIYSAGSSFAALKDDGSVVTWGHSDHGGDSSSVAEKLTSNVRAIFTTNAAYAALKEDGSIVTWGNVDYGGDSSFVSENLSSDVVNVFANAGAFAALKQDGSVVTWGNADYGGESSFVSENLSSDVVTIFPNTFYAFAALKKDGSVVTWGHKDYGGDSSAVVNQLSSNVVEIFTSDGAFAALKDDGSVVTWGHERYGGNSTNVQDQLNDVVDIYGTSYSGVFPFEIYDGGAFAAVKYDGSLVTWGDATQGGDSSNIKISIENSPPEFIFSESNASVSAMEDESFEYHLQAYDVDGNDLTFQSTQLPDWLILDEQEGILSGEPRDADVGMHNFILSVSDSVGDKSEIEVNINVLNSPDYQLNTSVLEITERDFYNSLDNGIYSITGNLFFEETRSNEHTYFDRFFDASDTHYFNNSGRGKLDFSVNQGIYEININTNLLDLSLYEPVSVQENYNIFTSPSFLIEKLFDQIERIDIKDGFPIYPIGEKNINFGIPDPNKVVHNFTIRLVPDVENYEPEFYSLSTRPGQYSITGGIISKVLWHDFGVDDFIHEDGVLTQFSREEQNDVEITLFDKNFDDLIIEPITNGVNKVSSNTRLKDYYTQNLLSRDTGAIKFSIDLENHSEINFDVEEKITLEFTASDNKTTKIIPIEIPVALNRTVSDFESDFQATEYPDYLLISGKDNTFSANAGNDLIETRNTAGHNVYSLDVGDDTAIIRSDSNIVNFGEGNDQLILRASDTWTNDYVVKNVAYANEEIGTGQTVLIAGKNRFSDVIDGGEGIDTVVLTDGDDVFVLQDSYSKFHSSQNLQLDEAGRLGAQRIIEIENIICGAGDDVIDLTSTDYLISDIGIKIEGDEGDDTIWGTPLNDEILGGDGNDTIFGGSGNDFLTGGLGEDTFEFTTTAGEDTITDFNILDDLLVFYATSGDSREVSSAAGSTILWDDVTITLGMSEVYTEQTLLENINVEFVLI